MFGIAFKNRSIFGYKSTTKQGMPSWFTTTQEKYNFM
jgi:hypothetical protein